MSKSEKYIDIDWQERNKSLILSQIGDELFPCVFAKKAIEKRTVFWAFCDCSDNGYSDFFNSLINYTEFLKKTDVLDRVLPPLIVVIKSDCLDLESQHKTAWNFIQYLIDNDPKVWNNDITKDVYDFKWCLYFNDVQLFINISCSKHKKLKSRNLSDDICLIINPREVFDLVAPYNRSKGLKIRNHIRERICLFNQTDTYPPELGFFGDRNNLEWRQYQLYEEGALDNTNCPIYLKNHSVKKR
ncbi:MAG: YqcI/YcgG family protein [Moraxella sp.]